MTNPITPLPDPPSIADPDNFESESDTFIAALPNMVDEINVVAEAFNLNSTNSTSTTSLAVGEGTKSLTVDASKSYLPGMSVKIARTSDPSIWMQGPVDTYNSGTGALQIDSEIFQGTGTYTDWTVTFAATNVPEFGRVTVAATATTTPLWDSNRYLFQDWTGAPTITDIPDAPQAGASRIVYPAAGTVFTDNATLNVQGNTNYTVAAGDRITITATTVSTFDVKIEANLANSKLDGTYISGLNVSINVTDPDHDLDITAGACTKSDASKIIRLASAITKRMDVAFVKGTNAGGLGNGLSIPISGQLFIFTITEDSTGDVDVYGDTSVAGANPPTGWTLGRFISVFKTDSSANFIPVTVNRWSDQLIEHQIITPVRDLNTTTQASSTPTNRSLATSVPVGKRLNIRIRFAVSHGTTATSMTIQDPLMVNSGAPAGTGAPLATARTGASGAVAEGETTVWTDVSAQVETDSSNNNTTIEIVTLSYFVSR
jgi:hypothetical protein